MVILGLSVFWNSLTMKNNYNDVKYTVIKLIEFVVIKLEDGLDSFKEIVDPSLDDLEKIITELMEEAKKHDDEGLNHCLFAAYALIKDVQNGCDEKLGAVHKKTLKGLSFNDM